MRNRRPPKSLRQARRAGAHALVLRDTSLDGAAMKAFTAVLRRDGIAPRVLQSHVRAALDARRDADELLRDSLGQKKLKELRRQRKRLADHGNVHFDVARTHAEVAAALETFLMLEASGWKAKRGTALVQDEGDAAFIRRATPALAADRPMRDRDLEGRRDAGGRGDRAAPSRPRVLFQARRRRTFRKIFAGRTVDAGIDPPSLRRSLDASANSTANPDHPMINPIWRERLPIGDVLIRCAAAIRSQAWCKPRSRCGRLAREPARRTVRLIRNRQGHRMERSA